MFKIGPISPPFRLFKVRYRKVRLELEHICGLTFCLVDLSEMGLTRSDVAVQPPVQEVDMLKGFEGFGVQPQLQKSCPAASPVPGWRKGGCDEGLSPG